MQQNSEDVYVDDSEDDLSEWQWDEMDADDELNTLMHFVCLPLTLVQKI